MYPREAFCKTERGVFMSCASGAHGRERRKLRLRYLPRRQETDNASIKQLSEGGGGEGGEGCSVQRQYFHRANQAKCSSESNPPNTIILSYIQQTSRVPGPLLQSVPLRFPFFFPLAH